MSTPYESKGRTDQKRRTRDALVAAARELVSRGETPTVEAAAAAASISRTTAYRYFPTQVALLAAAHPETGATTMLPADAPTDVEARVEIVVDAIIRTTARNEGPLRTMLRLSLEASAEERANLPLRQGRAIKWLEDALEPLQKELGKAEVHRLAVAIRSAVGIESLAWLVDVAQLSRKDAGSIQRWSARALLRAAVAEQGTRRR